MNGQRELDFPDGFKQNYEPAPLDFCLAQGRAMLERIYGVDLERLPAAGDGACFDCEREAALLAYGSVTVCRPCALRRRRAQEKAA